MQNNKDIFDLLGAYFWVLFVGLIGGLLNLGERESKSAKRKFADLLMGLASSCFCGWMGYEIINFIYSSERVALAGCGFFAWKGAIWVGVVTDKIIDRWVAKKDEF